MPRVISYTPPWLTRPSPGSDVFNASSTTKTATPSQQRPCRGPQRTIARCGQHLFVVVGNELRWTNFAHLKDEWTEKSRRRWSQSGRENGKSQSFATPDIDQTSNVPMYKILKVPVHEQMRQLIVSPHEEYLAIVTSHTVHITIIPDSSHIIASDTNTLKPKTFQLGPTVHVLDRSPIASVLWHPLGVRGTCLVTITKDATVRLWELSGENRYSFDEPALAVDLKKLANATCYEQDFRASRAGVSRGFSPDDMEMEVAAACFGGSGKSDEHGWSSMTLWLAMTEGDLYALCPLLPSKWQPSFSQIPSLSTSVVAKAAAVNAKPIGTGEERRRAEQQYRWFQDIDDQEPIVINDGVLGRQEIYCRPDSLSPIPKLQGPFLLDPEPEIFGEVTDIYVVAPKVDVDEWMFEEDYEDAENSEVLSVAIICVLTSSGYIHVSLDLDGVEAQWLPLKSTKRALDVDEALPALLLVEQIHICNDSEAGKALYPTFTPDANSRYASFVTHNNGVSYVSFTTWTSRLEDELTGASESGSTFRLDVFLDGLRSLVEHPIPIMRDRQLSTQDPFPISSALSFKDPDIGYFLLTTVSGQPHAAILDIAEDELLPPGIPSSYYHEAYAPNLSSGPAEPTTQYETRAAYQPPSTFWMSSVLPNFLKDEVPQRDRHLMTEEIKLSARSLGLMQHAHRILSQETSNLGTAAADLFTRSERLVRELKEQISRVALIRDRVELVVGTGDGDGDDGEKKGGERVEERLQNVRLRQEELSERYEALRHKVGRLGGKDLSTKEMGWKKEVENADEALTPLREDATDVDGEGEEGNTGLLDRFEEVKKLAGELIAQGREANGNTAHQASPTPTNQEEQATDSNEVRVAPAFRKAKITEVEDMLERTTAILDATVEKLDRLKLQAL